jgi:predicted nucleic acid-binding protein
MAEAVVMDAGPLILLAARDPVAVEWLNEALDRDAVLLCAGVTYAEVWRGHSQRPELGKKAIELDRVLGLLEPVPASEVIGRGAGQLLGVVDLGGRTHTIDAIVVATAVARSARVLTTDPDDLRRLATPAGVLVDTLSDVTRGTRKQTEAKRRRTKRRKR